MNHPTRGSPSARSGKPPLTSKAPPRTIAAVCTVPVGIPRLWCVAEPPIGQPGHLVLGDSSVPVTVPAGMVAVLIVTTPEHALALCADQVDDQPGEPS